VFHLQARQLAGLLDAYTGKVYNETILLRDAADATIKVRLRLFRVPASDRIHTVEGADRTLVVPESNRTLRVPRRQQSTNY
jgi:hypothetical protein